MARKTAKKAVKKTAAKKTTAKKTAPTKAKSAPAKYTKLDLREKIKAKVMKSDKGGRPGQWSARKAQLVATEYKAEGGDYKGDRAESQEHLKEWGDEKWHTKDGEKAIQGKETHRYLPDKAWNELSPAEKKKTDKKKVEGSKKGRQFVKNTPRAAAAGSKARTHKKTA